jgi:mercuric ion transport protein
MAIDKAIPAPRAAPRRLTRLLAGGGLLGAALGTTCCVLPFTLVVLGLGGAWLSWLTALAPYQPAILLATLALLGLGFWRIYGPAGQAACAADGACASRRPSIGIRLALWSAIALAAVTASVDLLL